MFKEVSSNVLRKLVVKVCTNLPVCFSFLQYGFLTCVGIQDIVLSVGKLFK